MGVVVVGDGLRCEVCDEVAKNVAPWSEAHAGTLLPAVSPSSSALPSRAAAAGCGEKGGYTKTTAVLCLRRGRARVCAKIRIGPARGASRARSLLCHTLLTGNAGRCLQGSGGQSKREREPPRAGRAGQHAVWCGDDRRAHGRLRRGSLPSHCVCTLCVLRHVPPASTAAQLARATRILKRNRILLFIKCAGGLFQQMSKGKNSCPGFDEGSSS